MYLVRAKKRRPTTGRCGASLLVYVGGMIADYEVHLPIQSQDLNNYLISPKKGHNLPGPVVLRHLLATMCANNDFNAYITATLL